MQNVNAATSRSGKCHADLHERICHAARSGKYHGVGSYEYHAAG